jgi:hypothetical protein
MTVAVNTLTDQEQIDFYNITSNMDSSQRECLNKLIGLNAQDIFADRGTSTKNDIETRIARWIRDHVLQTQEDYCDSLRKELANRRP